MIRDAIDSDIPYLVPAAKSYLEETGDGQYLSFDETTYINNALAMIGEESVKIQINDKQGPVGHCAMLVTPSLFDNNQFTGKIFSVWGDGAFGLVKRCEKWAKERGVAAIYSDSHKKLKQKSIARAYKKMGYELSDQLYMKIL